MKEKLTKTEQQQEALSRLRSLGLIDNVVKDFKTGKLNVSERRTLSFPVGILFWPGKEEETVIRDFEAEHNAIVYHVVKTFMEYGEELAFLYVSDCPEEWEMEKNDLKNGETVAYVTDKFGTFGEFGSIGIKESGGGLIRTW